MFCPPDSLWFPDGTNVKTLSPQIGAIGKTAWLYGLCEPVVIFEAAVVWFRVSPHCIASLPTSHHNQAALVMFLVGTSMAGS